MKKIKNLATNVIQELTPYLSARRIGGKGQIWLNANEVPNCSQFKINSDRLNRYPEFQPPELLKAYVAFSAQNNQPIGIDQLLITRGANESIELLIRTFCEVGKDSILICPPTYGMFSVSAQTHDVAIKEVPLIDNFDVDYEGIQNAVLAEDSHVKLVFLCAPNNPTGNMLDKEKLKLLLQATKNNAVIVVDEAYIEFCSEFSQIDLVNKYDNIAIIRTLSKAFAMASIRCGFTIAPQHIIEMVSKVLPPYPVPDPIAQIATQGLKKTGVTAMKYRVKTLNNNKDEFKLAIEGLSCVIDIFCATGNFLLVRFQDANKVFHALSNKAIITRDFSDVARLDNCIRITIGSKDEMKSVINVLKSLSKA
ncbi:MAG: histidinol-phosphate transaminase [Psychromonas sp.]|nr:histidinol-phosphate transaminase [Psychromonas sp.]